MIIIIERGMNMHNNPVKILIVAEDTNTRIHLYTALTKEGYDVDGLLDPGALFVQAAPLDYSLIILEAGIASQHGEHLCLWIKKDYDIPVIVLTHHNDQEMLESFQAGADDCVVKPISIKEMLLRIQAMLRRYSFLRSNDLMIKKDDDCIKLSHIKVETSAHKIFADHTPVKLTLKEYDLLAYMARHPNVVLSREQLLHAVWKQSVHNDYRTIDTHIKRVRDKLSGASTAAAQMIQTVRGIGYMLRTPGSHN